MWERRFAFEIMCGLEWGVHATSLCQISISSFWRIRFAPFRSFRHSFEFGLIRSGWGMEMHLQEETNIKMRESAKENNVQHLPKSISLKTRNTQKAKYHLQSSRFTISRHIFFQQGGRQWSHSLHLSALPFWIQNNHCLCTVRLWMRMNANERAREQKELD